MLTNVFDFLWAFVVMCAWAGIAGVLLFIGVFVMNLIGDRTYGRNNNRRN